MMQNGEFRIKFCSFEGREWFMRYASGIILWEVVWLAASIMTQSHILSCTRTHQTQTLSIFCTSQIYRQNPSLPPPSVSRKMLSHFQDRMLNQILLEKSQTQLFFNKIPPFYIKRCRQNLMNFVFFNYNDTEIRTPLMSNSLTLLSFPPKSCNPNPWRVPLISSLRPRQP